MYSKKFKIFYPKENFPILKLKKLFGLDLEIIFYNIPT